jgi:hypothetical protein
VRVKKNDPSRLNSTGRFEVTSERIQAVFSSLRLANINSTGLNDVTLGAYASTRVNHRSRRHRSSVDGSSRGLSDRSNRGLTTTNRLGATLVAGIFATRVVVAAAILKRIAAEVAEQLVEQASLAARIVAAIASALTARITTRIAAIDRSFATADGLWAARLWLAAGGIAAIGLATGSAATVIATAVLLEQVAREQLAEHAAFLVARIAGITRIATRIATRIWVAARICTIRRTSLLTAASRFVARHIAPAVTTVAG